MDYKLLSLAGGAVVVGHCLYLIGVLFNLSARSTNRILSVILFLFAVRAGKSVISLLISQTDYAAAVAGVVAMAALGPLLLLYSRQLYDGCAVANRGPYFHFLPVVTTLPLIAMHDWRLMSYYYYIFTAHLIFYTAYSAFHLQRNRTYYKADDLQWKWIWQVVAAFALLDVSFAIQVLVYDPFVYVLNVVVAAVIVYGLSFLALRSSRLFNPLPKKKPAENLPEKDLGASIQKLLEREEVYCDPDLTITKLAGILKLPPYRVSRAVNQFFGTSFPEVLLGYRLRKAEQLLLTKGELFSIEGVAYESGFNTLSAFYASFKKVHGITPSQFKQRRSGGDAMKIAR